MRKLRLLRFPSISQIGFGLSVLTVLSRLTLFVIRRPFIEGDTELLVKVHINAIRACLQAGQLVACPGGVWPLFQNLPGLLLNFLGFSSSSILHALAYLSFLSFLGSVVLIFWTLKKKTSVALAVTGSLIVITSPLLWYSHSTFGEMAAAFLILAFTSACLTRARLGVVVLLFILAGSTKETALPFLLLIGLVCLLPDVITDPRSVRSRVYVLGLSAVFSLIVAAGFNYFRFTTVSNPYYLRNLFIVPSLRIQASFFLGIWFSPNGGLLFFWPSFVLLYLSVFGVLLFEFMRKKSLKEQFENRLVGLTHYLPIIPISVILFLLTAGFSRWYTPLGGAAWGPRYMIPWIPAVLLLVLFFYHEEVERILQLVLSKPFGFVFACMILIVVSIPQFSILFGDFVLAKIFAYPECPRVPVIQEGTAYYYQCLQTQIWPSTLIISELYQVALRARVLWFSIPYCVVLIGGLHWVRSSLVKNEINSKAASAVESRVAAGAALGRAIEKSLRHCLFVVAFYSLVFVAFFFPAIYQGNLLAVGGDGLFIYLPNFYSRKVLWDTLLFSGFPMMADPQVATWYPPALLLSQFPGSWNVFMIMAYIAGSSFMYGYVFTLTRSRFAALTSGLVFGLSGFMMAHLGHAVIIHAAVWIPLIIWALERLRHKLSAPWVIIGSVAVTLCFLGGHSQIFFYGLILSVAYAVTLGGNAPIGRARYYLVSLSMLLMGISLAAIQIIPTAELLGQSGRVGYNFQDFVSHALPPRQALTMIFPTVFGGMGESGALPYFGATNQTELTGYVGLLPLMLAAVGLRATRKKSLGWFWLCVALLAFLLVMGEATPLARLIYHVPILNGFRAPARHFIEFTMAVSVLSGLGVAAILRQEVPARLLRRVILIAGLSMIACVVLLFMNLHYMAALATQKEIVQLSLLPWKNRAVGIPIIIFLLGTVAVACWHKLPVSLARKIFLLAILVIDLGSFGWFYEWRYASPDKTALNAPETATRYKTSLDATHQRLMPYRSPRGSIAEMPPNLTRLWGVPSASGYNVLIFSRISNLFPMIDYLGTRLPWSDPDNQSLNLMAVRYLFLPPNQSSTDERGVSWLDEDIQFWLGSGCNQPSRKSATVALMDPVKSSSLAIVSRLACSSQIPDGTEVARVKLVDANGQIQERTLVAGHDASEWAYDCDRVRPFMKHQRASIFKNYPAKFDGPCEGHSYVTTLPLGGVKDIKSIEFEWIYGPGAIILEKLALVDESTHRSFPVDPAMLNSNGWRLIEETDSARIYENLRAMPRAWLATEVIRVTPEQALNTIKTSTLPDGHIFDPNQTALVEAPLTLNPVAVDGKATATVALLTNTRMEVHTSSTTAGFLITSDAYYPGWQATIDGQEAQLYRADYAIRGVVVPPGEHFVRFDYRPRSFYYGAAISALSLVLLGALGLRTFFRKNVF